MTTVVLVGGNGYIGRAVTTQWLARDPEVQIYVTSRSDRAEVQDPRVHHVQADPSDAEAFAKALPESVDYVVNLTYGSEDALKGIREYAEKHGAKAIGNVGIDAQVPGFEDFVAMKKSELAYLRESDVRVANVDISVAYGNGRDDDLMTMVRSGALDEQNPIDVEIVARLLIDRLVRDWAE